MTDAQKTQVGSPCSCGGTYQAEPNDADRPDGPWSLVCDRCGLDPAPAPAAAAEELTVNTPYGNSILISRVPTPADHTPDGKPDCPQCEGDGRCLMCYGSKSITILKRRSSPKARWRVPKDAGAVHHCTDCWGTGRCQQCHPATGTESWADVGRHSDCYQLSDPPQRSEQDADDMPHDEDMDNESEGEQ